MRKTTALRRLIRDDSIGFLLEAHDGLSAKIVEEAGFKGIWSSGLSISAAFGVRDANEASWTQVLEHVEFMADATSLPILLDADTGYGNFNTVRRLVRKLESRGVAGMCIEDNTFPKTNSFLCSKTQGLADCEEFSGRIRAAKDTQRDADFVVVARTEALVLGHGQAEALRRAEAYRDAGADAVLVHSKRADANEIETFAKVWGRRHPLAILPTSYAQTPTERFETWGVDLVIWANHMLRGAIAGMRKVAARIQRERSVAGRGDAIVPLSDVFALQDVSELEQAELRYLPARREGTKG